MVKRKADESAAEKEMVDAMFGAQSTMVIAHRSMLIAQRSMANEESRSDDLPLAVGGAEGGTHGSKRPNS